MKWFFKLNLFATIFLIIFCFSTGSLVRAQSEDELSLEGLEEDLQTQESPSLDSSTSADSSASDRAVSSEEEDVNFDDFGEETDPNSEDSHADEQITEESTPNENGEDLNLEPLDEDNDQVTEITEKNDAEKTEEEKPKVESQRPLEPSPAPTTPEPMMITHDEPDLSYEAKLYDIYLKYNSKKLSDQEWQELIGERQSEVYKIQRGDTLWSISKTFFNDGNYWPKIWQLNSAITNPHLIQPGNTIHFLLGTESEAPAFAVTEETDETISVPLVEGGEEDDSGKKGSVAGEKGSGTPTDEIEIPPPSIVYTPPLKKIPPSLIESGLASPRGLGKYDDVGIDYGRRPILDLKEKKYLESYLDDKMMQEDGEVKEIEGGARTASSLQYVFISLPQGKGKPGEFYTVILAEGPLPRVSDEIAARDLGYTYKILGEVKLAELLSTTQDEKPRDIYRALVTKSLTQVLLGAVVVKGRIPEVSTDLSGEKSNAVTQIIGAGLIDKQKTFSLYSVAYIDGGQNKNLKPGQILTIRANTKVRNEDSIVKESYIPIGQIKLVKVGVRFSTGIVVRVWDSIFVGDVTGDGKVLPPEKESESHGKVTKEAKVNLPEAESGSEGLEEEWDSGDGSESDLPLEENLDDVELDE